MDLSGWPCFCVLKFCSISPVSLISLGDIVLSQLYLLYFVLSPNFKYEDLMWMITFSLGLLEKGERTTLYSVWGYLLFKNHWIVPEQTRFYNEWRGLKTAFRDKSPLCVINDTTCIAWLLLTKLLLRACLRLWKGNHGSFFIFLLLRNNVS